MIGWIQLFQAALNLLRKPWKAMLAMLLLSACALYAPYSRGDDWLRVHRTMEWSCFLFAAFYLVAASLEWLIKHLLLRRHFENLPGDERRVISAFMLWNTRTTGLISGAATAVAMTKIGVLEITDVPNENNVKVRRGDSFFTIKPWVFRYLRKRPGRYSLENEVVSADGVSFQDARGSER